MRPTLVDGLAVLAFLRFKDVVGVRVFLFSAKGEESAKADGRRELIRGWNEISGSGVVG